MEEMKVVQGDNYVHLFSGGLDSTYSLFRLCRELEKVDRISYVQPIFMDYGQYASMAEWSSVRKVSGLIQSELSRAILNEPIIISLRSDLFIWSRSVAFCGKETSDSTPEIENRNMVLLSILYSYAIACARNQGISSAAFNVSSGFIDKEISDCSKVFFDGLSGLMQQYHPEYTMSFHLLPEKLTRKATYSKLKDLLKGSQDKLKGLLAATISCYSPIDGKPCGKCWKCRMIAEGKL